MTAPLKFFCCSLLFIVPLIANSETPQSQAKLLAKADDFEQQGKADSVIFYLKKYGELIEKSGKTREAINVYNRIVLTAHQAQDFTAALTASKKAYALSVKIGDKKLIANSLNNMGTIYHALGNLKESMKYFFMGIRIADTDSTKTLARRIYNNISSVFIDLKDKKNSLLYAQKSYKMALEINDSLQIAKSLSNLAISEEINGLDESAASHLRQQAEISKKKNWPEILSDSYNNLAEIYIKQKKFGSALALYQQAMKLQKSSSSADDVAFLNLGIANCYKQLKHFSAAEKYYDKAIGSAEKLMYKNDLKEIYHLGAEIKEALGKSSAALNYQKRYSVLNDSLNNLETQKFIHEAELKYQTSVKERRLAQQQLQISIKNRYIMIAVFLIIFLIGAIALINLANKARSQAMKLVLLQAQIHPHFLFNTLNNLYALSMEKSDDAPEVILGLSQILRYILYECNDGKISLQREIEIIEKYIFLERIRYHSRLEINFNVEGEIGDQQIAPLFLLPLIENAFKHGISQLEAEGWIHINLKVKKDSFIFKIANNKPEKAVEDGRDKKHGHIGLNNIKKRLHILYPKKHELKIIKEAEDFIVILKIDL